MAGRQVSVADLHPDIMYRFTLNPVYRVTVGEFYPGQIIGDEPSRNSFPVDFGGEFSRTIVLKDDDSFENESDL
jgi:hypothetical protein